MLLLGQGMVLTVGTSCILTPPGLPQSMELHQTLLPRPSKLYS